MSCTKPGQTGCRPQYFPVGRRFGGISMMQRISTHSRYPSVSIRMNFYLAQNST